MSMMKTFCPHCGRVVPKGQRCACRPRPKRKPAKGDGTEFVIMDMATGQEWIG